MPSSRPFRARIRRACSRAPALVEAVGHRQRLAVIGDGDVRVTRRRAPRAPSSRRRRGRRSRSCACADRPADLRVIRTQGSVAVLCRFDLAAVLAQLGRDECEAERPIDLFFGSTRDELAVVDPEEAIFVELEAALDRAIAESDVVRLRAGEILQRGAEAFARHDAQIGLKAAPEQHARLGLAVREHALDELVAREGVHQRRRRAGGEDVEIAAGLAAAPQAANGRDVGVGGVLTQRRKERVGGFVRLRHQPASSRTGRAPRAP